MAGSEKQSILGNLQCLGSWSRDAFLVAFGEPGTSAKLRSPSETVARQIAQVRAVVSEIGNAHGWKTPDGFTKRQAAEWGAEAWRLYVAKIKSLGLYHAEHDHMAQACGESGEAIPAAPAKADPIGDKLAALQERVAAAPSPSQAEAQAPSPQQTATPSPASTQAASSFRIETFDDIMKDEPETELIEGVMPSKGVVNIYGPSGTGKTFVAVDMGIRIAGGMPWHGRRVEERPVLYFYLEAGGNLKKRLQVWDIEYPGEFPKDNIGFVRLNSIDLIADWKKIVPLLYEGSVVFLDTLHKSAAGKDENSNTEMGLVLNAAGELAKAIDGIVIIIHHTGKDRTRGQRGAQCLLDDVTCVLAMKESNGKKYIEVEKNKDELAGIKFPYFLKVIDTGEKKPSGAPIASCVAIQDTTVKASDIAPAKATTTLRSGHHQIAYQALERALDANSGEPVSRAFWKQYYATLDPIEPESPDGVPTQKEKDAFKKRCKHAIDSLVEKGLVGLTAEGLLYKC